MILKQNTVEINVTMAHYSLPIDSVALPEWNQSRFHSSYL